MKAEARDLELVLSEEEARIAAAFLDGLETGELLRRQIIDRVLSRKVIRVGLVDHIDPGQDPNAVLSEAAPDLYEYRVPDVHRAPLIGAFATGAEIQEIPQDNAMLFGLAPEEVRAISASARESLLHPQNHSEPR